jgi:hypothetical protein
MNVHELKVDRPSRIQAERTSPRGQSTGKAAEREVRVPACEQSINGSPDKHKGVVWATRASCSRETGCSAAKWATRRRGLGCLRWRARSLAHVRAGVCTHSARKAESHPGGRAHMGWTGRAEGFDPSGVCIRICAEVGGVAHGGDTKPRARARRRHRDKSTTNRFKRRGVQGRGGQKGSNLGSMARRTHVRRCVGVCGDGTTECQARSKTGEAGAQPLGCVRSCVCRTPTARPWRRHETDGVH